MCGIIGLWTAHPTGIRKPELTVFNQGLILSTLRGQYGTGLFCAGDEQSQWITKEYPNKFYWVKHCVNPFQLFEDVDWPDIEAKRLLRSRLIVGHTRSPTTGKITTTHTHPFVHGDIVMVHNGTIHSISGWSKEFHEFDSDSDALCKWLSLHSEEEYPKALQAVHGSMTVVWYNYKNCTLYIYRNLQRPLAALKTDHLTLIASEKLFLTFLAQRDPVGLGISHSKRVEYEDIEAFKLYKFRNFELDASEVVAVPQPVVAQPDPWKLQLRQRLSEAFRFRDWVIPALLNKTGDDDEDAVNSNQQDALKTNKNKKDKKKKKNKSGIDNIAILQSHFGLEVGDDVFVVPENLEKITNGKFCISGSLEGIVNKPLNDCNSIARVRFFLNGMADADVAKLYRSAYLKGKVVNIGLNKNDISDIRVYCIHPRIASFKEVTDNEATVATNNHKPQFVA